MKCCKNCRWLKWVTTTDTFYYCSFDGGELSGDLSYCCPAWEPSDDYKELADAVHVVLSFLDKCHGGETYLIAPDGTELSMDVGYVCEGLETLKAYAIAKGG